MLEHSSHCAFIVAYNDINDKLIWWNEYSIIFITALAYILLELPSKFFGNSCSSAYYPLLYSASHFIQAFEYRTIAIMHLDIPLMMKACPLEESHLLPEDIFCNPILYVTVSFTLFSFIYSSYRSHHCTYD